MNLDPVIASKLLTRIATQTGLNDKQVFTAISIICQKGGTAQPAQDNLYAIVHHKKLTLDHIGRVKDGGDGNEKLKLTLGQFARTYSDSHSD